MKRIAVSSPILSGRFLLLLLFLVLSFVFLFAMARKTSAGDRRVEVYYSVTVQDGDSLWSLAEANTPADMDISEYIQKVRRINHLNTNEIISGDALILPVYTEASE